MIIDNSEAKVSTTNLKSEYFILIYINKSYQLCSEIIFDATHYTLLEDFIPIGTIDENVHKFIAFKNLKYEVLAFLTLGIPFTFKDDTFNKKNVFYSFSS